MNWATVSTTTKIKLQITVVTALDQKEYALYGEIELDVPRDRNGTFEPIIVKKNQRNVSRIDDQVISMYAKGMTLRDIQSHLQSLYGIEISPTMISQITQKIMPVIKDWQQRPLQEI